jgi:Na+/H+ antiporter
VALVHTLVVLILCAVALGWAARRMDVPYPIALVIGGTALSFLPGLPQVEFDPNLVLVVVLPPILYQAALATSWRDFRANLRPISLLAVGLVITTTVVVAGVVKFVVPEMPWAVAFVLGAIVSPPDAVAATAVLSRMSMPRRIVTILEGESLVNDASGLVLYKFALAAALTGTFSLVDGTWRFVFVAIGGLAVGYLIGRLFVFIHDRLHDSLAEILFSLVLPYTAYLAAESLHVSGVLAVVAAGLVRGRFAPERFSAQSRLLAHSTWSIVVFLLNCLVFILIGLQLGPVMGRLAGDGAMALAGYALVTVFATILVRFLWVYPAAWLPRFLWSRLRESDPMPGWRSLFAISWCGMRGIVSLAAALAIPFTLDDGTPFPQRDLVIFLTVAVIFGTLVLQGLTLAPIIRRLGIGADWDAFEEQRLARTQITRAALEEIERFAKASHLSEEDLAAVSADYRARLRGWSAHGLISTTADDPKPLRRAALAAERAELIRLWRDALISDEVLHEVERELDLEEARLGH